MSVWYCLPSARPIEEAERCLCKWRERGYNVAVWRDEDNGSYPGYAVAVNNLAYTALLRDPDCDWIVAGADDIYPDPDHDPDEIARECSQHFGMLPEDSNPSWVSTYGVMQPTGDRWTGLEGKEAYIDKIAGSPWLGREWCMRAHQGRGPLHPGFQHMFVDQALREAAIKQGVYWERRDLTHYHAHALRDKKAPTSDDWPAHMRPWCTPQHWRESKALYERLKADGFKECLPR